MLLELAGGEMAQIGLSHVIQAARQGDQVALTALEETGEYLGIGIANLLNAFNPSLVILGGPLGMAGEFLLPAIERTVERRALKWTRRSARVVPSAHGADAAVFGSIALILDEIMGRPLVVNQ